MGIFDSIGDLAAKAVPNPLERALGLSRPKTGGRPKSLSPRPVPKGRPKSLSPKPVPKGRPKSISPKPKPKPKPAPVRAKATPSRTSPSWRPTPPKLQTFEEWNRTSPEAARIHRDTASQIALAMRIYNTNTEYIKNLRKLSEQGVDLFQKNNSGYYNSNGTWVRSYDQHYDPQMAGIPGIIPQIKH